MSRNTARNALVCSVAAEARAGSRQRRKRRPQNRAAVRRKSLRARGSLKSIPSHWSPRQIAKRLDLRKWEDGPTILKKDTYAVSLLIDQKREGRLKPYVLSEVSALDCRLAFILNCVTLCCMVRGAKAVSGDRVAWGQLVGVGGTKAFEMLRQLVDEYWLERLPQFVPHCSTGRDGEHLDHRQVQNYYRPGIRLKAAWQNLQSELANQARRRVQKPRSPADANRLPSLRSKSIQASGPNIALTQATSLVDKKEPPSAGSIVSPPLAAPAPALPRLLSSVAVQPNFPTSQGGQKVTASGGKSNTADKANQHAVCHGPSAARPPRPIPEEDRALLDGAAVDIAHARILWKTYLSDRGDGVSRGMACAMARATLNLLAQSERGPTERPVTGAHRQPVAVPVEDTFADCALALRQQRVGKVDP